jgi:L-seryl-tRNA(Ser) seleniumtransferase
MKRKRPKRITQRVRGSSFLRCLPSVDELLVTPRLAQFAADTSRLLVVEAARAALKALRTRAAEHPEIAASNVSRAELREELITEIIADVERLLQPSLLPVINATGVVLHTNLGRAPLCAEAFMQMRATATQYSNLEYDLETGARGARDIHTAKLLESLTGAEAAIVVNNNAAAVFLVLASLARGGEVIVSRGELIEIGDGFRIPDIMAESGAALREVGTTNRTSLADYERAINSRTRLLLRVHRSNFHMDGFTAQPSLAELVKLGRRASLPVYEDLGSGCLLEIPASGVAEPLVRESLAAGASIVSFSGDKLLGGPQAGVIAGNREIVTRIRRHPMFRALRVDKLTIAGLEATLLAYLRGAGTTGHHAIPAVRMIQAGAEEIASRAAQLVAALQNLIAPEDASFELRDAESVIGGGSTPGRRLATCVISVESRRYSAAALDERLRRGNRGIPVIARVEKNRLLLDLRTVFPEQESVLAETLASTLAV